MLRLNEFETCPYFSRCPHNNNIQSWKGLDPKRSTKFECSFIDVHGNISESGFRNPLDQTGKQQILRE